jgi:hypothetical protein
MAVNTIQVEDTFYGKANTIYGKFGNFEIDLRGEGAFKDDDILKTIILNLQAQGKLGDYVKTVGPGSIIMYGEGAFKDFVFANPIMQLPGQGVFSDDVILIKILNVADTFKGKSEITTNSIVTKLAQGLFRDGVVPISVMQLLGQGVFSDLPRLIKIIRIADTFKGKSEITYDTEGGTFLPSWTKTVPHSPSTGWTKVNLP